jgi:hypothetical protein
MKRGVAGLNETLLGQPGSRAELETPALLLDADRFEASLDRLAQLARLSGMGLRPHAKSHKCAAIAERQMAAGALGIACAKPGELLALFEAGLTKLMLTAPVSSRLKIDRLTAAAARGLELIVVVDRLELVAAFGASLTPIVCIGETLEEREAEQTLAVLDRQIKDGLDGLTSDQLTALVIAYEPVWAIGTGRTASPEQAQAMHAFIRRQIAGHDARIADSLPILYGGSVKPDNAGALFAQPDVDGGLIGGASLVAADFLAIARAAASAP